MKPKAVAVIKTYAFLATLIILAAPSLCIAQTDCSNYSCPQGCLCACEDCGYCNSGSFVVTCTCCPVPGETVRDVSNGSCLTNTCNQSCSTGSYGEHCQFNGCTGQSCPQNFSPELSGLGSVLRPVAFSSASTTSPPCGNPAQGVEEPACDGCVSRKINLGTKTEGATGELLIPTDIPLAYFDVRVNLQEDGGIRGGSYTLRNNSKAGLVTLITSWKFEGEANGPAPVISNDLIDSWATDTAFLRPGEEKREVLNFDVLAPKGAHVRHVTGSVLYAEFDDGTRLGPAMTEIYPNLRRERQEILNDYTELLGKIEAGLPEAVLGQYIQETRGLKWLTFIRAKGGWDAVVSRISRPRRLRP